MTRLLRWAVPCIRSGLRIPSHGENEASPVGRGGVAHGTTAKTLAMGGGAMNGNPHRTSSASRAAGRATWTAMADEGRGSREQAQALQRGETATRSWPAEPHAQDAGESHVDHLRRPAIQGPHTPGLPPCISVGSENPGVPLPAKTLPGLTRDDLCPWSLITHHLVIAETPSAWVVGVSRQKTRKPFGDQPTMCSCSWPGPGGTRFLGF